MICFKCGLEINAEPFTSLRDGGFTGANFHATCAFDVLADYVKAETERDEINSKREYSGNVYLFDKPERGL